MSVSTQPDELRTFSVRDTAALLSLHPQQRLREKAIAKFWVRLDRSSGCWLWTGYKTYRRYGLLWFGTKNVSTHRLAWMLTYGDIPHGLYVCHTCDNPPCCNPSHLWLGTSADNAHDRDAKGRGGALFGEQNPASKLTAEQIEEIRRSYVPRKVSQDRLAIKFGVSQTVIGSIVRDKTWRGVGSDR